MSRTVEAMLVFATVVHQGSFTAAARQLGLSKAAVSLKIRQLEERLGIKLLNRSTRRLSLTEMGWEYYHSCQKVQAEIRSAEERIAELQGEPIGTLRVTCSVNFGSRHITPAIAAFKRRYPAIGIELLMGDQLKELVADNIDVAFRPGPLPPSQLIARSVVKCPFVLCAAPTYLERHPAPENVYELAEHNWVIYSMGQRFHHLQVGYQGEMIQVDIQGDVVTDNSIARRLFLLAGLGIARMAEIDVREDLQNGSLIQLLPDCHFGSVEMYAVYTDRRFMTQKLKLFLAFITEWLATDK